jgi:chorismate mutase
VNDARDKSSPEAARRLAELRRSFDDVDARLIALLAERMRLSQAAGALKRAAGLPIVDELREAHAATTRVAQAEAAGAPRLLVDEVFAVVVRHSRQTQGAPG